MRKFDKRSRDPARIAVARIAFEKDVRRLSWFSKMGQAIPPKEAPWVGISARLLKENGSRDMTHGYRYSRCECSSTLEMVPNDCQGWKKKQGLTNAHSNRLSKENLEYHHGTVRSKKVKGRGIPGSIGADEQRKA